MGAHALLLARLEAGSQLGANGDGLTNLQEYLAVWKPVPYGPVWGISGDGLSASLGHCGPPHRAHAIVQQD